MQQRTTFLTSVLAPQGVYCVVGLKKGTPKQVFTETLDEVEHAVEDFVSKGYDTYFGCAKYATATDGRTAKNAKWFKSFWLDLDCGENKPYENQKSAVSALKVFIEATGLPRPTLVNSGRGIHAYWVLKDAISYNDWKPTAEALKKFCASHHLHADPAVTADAARILRVPDTLNFKDSSPKNVYVLKESAPTDFAAFQALVGVSPEDAEENSSPFDTVPRRALDATTRALMGNSVSKFSAIMRKSASGEGCSQLVHIYKHQADIEEPLWRAGLSIAVNCEDGDTAIHKISSQHPEYDPKETATKASLLKDKPYKCVTFSTLNPDGCEGCPNKDKLTSPIQIGARIAAAKAEDNIVVMKSATLDQEVTVEIPEYPFPYFRGRNGGVYRRGRGEDKDELICEYDFYVVKRLTDPGDGESLWFRLHMPKDGIREFSAALSAVLSKDKFRELLAFNGITALDKKLVNIMSYVTRWVQELQQLEEAEKARQQFGWHENDTKFVIGNREITAAGVNYSPSSSGTVEAASFYTKRGDIREWSKVANIYALPGNEDRAFALFCGFGSALFKFTKHNGLIVHLTNNGSGVGKTTIQLLINSIWGRPSEPLMNQEDKYLARMHRIAVLGNLPPTIDELTNMEDKEVSNMAYAITHGRGRNRMQSQVNAERSNDLRWSSIAITSGNKSLYDQLFALKDFPEGELMRIIEITISKNDNLSKAESDAMFNPMYENYGIAGEIFIRYVIANLPEVLKLMEKVQRKFDAAAGFTQRERYWSAGAACAITAGMITRRLGLHDIEVSDVYAWAVKFLRGLKDDIRPENTQNPLGQLGLFLNATNSNWLVVNSTADRRSGTFEIPVREPRGELINRLEPDTMKLYITAKKLREWCNDNQISYKALEKNLIKTGVSIGLVKKSMSKGSDIATPAVAALVIDCAKATELDIETYLPNADGKK